MAVSIPAARTALFDALDAQTGASEDLEGVAVIRTGKWETIPERDIVAVLNARDIQLDPAHLGPPAGLVFNEVYVIPVYVGTSVAGNDIEAAETRLWELVTAVHTIILTDPRLDGTVLKAIPGDVADPGEQSGPTEDGKSVAAFVTLEVNVLSQSQLT